MLYNGMCCVVLCCVVCWQDRVSAAERAAAESDLEARRWKMAADEAALQVRATGAPAGADTVTQELKRAHADLTEAQHDRRALDQELGTLDRAVVT